MKCVDTMTVYTFNMTALEQAYGHSNTHVDGWYNSESCYNCERPAKRNTRPFARAERSFEKASRVTLRPLTR